MGETQRKRMSPRRAVRLLTLLLALASALAVFILSLAPWRTFQQRPVEPVVPPPAVNDEAAVWRTSSPPRRPAAGDVWVDHHSGIELVYIPSGVFRLGTSEAEAAVWTARFPSDPVAWFEDQMPQCSIRLKGFWIGRVEVTNAQYAVYLENTGRSAPSYWEGNSVPPGMNAFPVEGLSWDDARRYCYWAGLRLPTEWEWEKSARGPDGRAFPWGNTWGVSKCRNLSMITGQVYLTLDDWMKAESEWRDTHDPHKEGPTPVGSIAAGASPYGCFDMAGNVSEWCADWHKPHAYSAYCGNGSGGEARDYHVFRGGSWQYGQPFFFRTASRTPHYPAGDYMSYGFRVARDAN